MAPDSQNNIQRVERRHKTLLSVRFGTATEFVTEYAENLSSGGLFVRGAHLHKPLSQVEVEITLPGHATFIVVAKIAHILDKETALRFEREPGAGLQLLHVPQGFDKVLTDYLHILGQRRDQTLLVQEQDCLTLVENAGYRAKIITISGIEQDIEQQEEILALVSNKNSAANFRQTLHSTHPTVPVIGCDWQTQEELLLRELDRLAITKAQNK